MNRILIRNLLLSTAWFFVVIYLIATKNAQYAAVLLPSILTLWMHNGRTFPPSKKERAHA